MKKSIPLFTANSFRLDSGFGTVGQYHQYGLINMYFGLESEKRGKKYFAADLPAVLTNDHVAVLTILLPSGHPLQTVCKCERLTISEQSDFLKSWILWSRHLQLELDHCAPNKGVPVWLAASSTVNQKWSVDGGFWSALSFAEKAPEATAVPLLLGTTSFVGRQA
jgi:hypothetical protein